MRLTKEEEQILETIRAVARDGIPIEHQREALLSLAQAPTRKKKKPSAKGLVEAFYFLDQMEECRLWLLRLQKEVPRGRRSTEAILEALESRRPRAGSGERNGWHFLASHLSDHRNKIPPDLTITDRAALMVVELSTDLGRFPGKEIAKRLVDSARERIRHARAVFGASSFPDEVRRFEETLVFLRQKARGVGLFVPDRSLPWLMKRRELSRSDYAGLSVLRGASRARSERSGRRA